MVAGLELRADQQERGVACASPACFCHVERGRMPEPPPLRRASQRICWREFSHRRFKELLLAFVTESATQGSFDFAGWSASGPPCSAQDDIYGRSVRRAEVGIVSMLLLSKRRARIAVGLR